MGIARGDFLCETRALPSAFIPAKAGIHSASHWKFADGGLDSRLRGNDRWFVGEVIPGDATVRAWILLASQARPCECDFMRTTVDLPDSLFRRIRSVAALRGSTLKEFIQEALQRAVTSDRRVRRRKVTLPLIRSKHPGALRLTNADIENHLA